MTIFSKIAAGEIPSYKCAESDRFYAFLDIDPVTKGHTLVIPRKEVDYIFDMEDEELAAFEVFAKKVARAIKAVFPCRKVAQVVLGLEVNHAHIHLLPMNSEADVDCKNIQGFPGAGIGCIQENRHDREVSGRQRHTDCVSVSRLYTGRKNRILPLTALLTPPFIFRRVIFFEGCGT